MESWVLVSAVHHFTDGESEASRRKERSGCAQTVKDMRQEPGPKHFAKKELPASLQNLAKHWLELTSVGGLREGLSFSAGA